MIKSQYKSPLLDLRLRLSLPVFRPQALVFILGTEFFEMQRRLVKARAHDHTAAQPVKRCVRRWQCRQGTCPTQAAGHSVRAVCPKYPARLNQNVWVN
jgi:hypothetical protein